MVKASIRLSLNYAAYVDVVRFVFPTSSSIINIADNYPVGLRFL